MVSCEALSAATQRMSDTVFECRGVLPSAFCYCAKSTTRFTTKVIGKPRMRKKKSRKHNTKKCDPSMRQFGKIAKSPKNTRQTKPTQKKDHHEFKTRVTYNTNPTTNSSCATCYSYGYASTFPQPNP